MKKIISALLILSLICLASCTADIGNEAIQDQEYQPFVDNSESVNGDSQLENGDSQLENENLILGPGTYTVGKDIAPGVYDCLANSGLGVLRGDIASCSPVGFIQTMGSSSVTIGEYSSSIEGASSYKNLTLTDGDIIYIEMSLYVEFVPKET